MNILVIGASSGIGRALCLHYAAQGHRVFATGRRIEKLHELSHSNNCILSFKLDITRQNETEEIIQQIWSRAQSIHTAIVCAGIGDLNPELKHELNAETINTNVVGWTHVVDFVYHQFEQQKFGHLATITSLNAMRGEPVAPAYSASKAFQSNYTEALCKKAFKSNLSIYVTEIRPGLVQTAMAKGERLFWVMPAERVAKQIAKAIKEKSRLRIVTKRWKIVAFVMKHLPWWLYKRI